MTTETMTIPRTWDVPAEPAEVTEVEAADGAVWRITDCPGVDSRTHRWAKVKTEGTRDPESLSWRSLVRLEGPLTEVTS